MKTWALQVLQQAGWAPLLVLVVYFVTSRVFDLYASYPRLDIPMHFAGGLAASYIFAAACQSGCRMGFMGKPNILTQRILTFCLACVAAVLWEFGEFLSDQLLGTHEQLGLHDTMVDLMVGMLGSIACIILLHVLDSRNRS
jgi:hypothetical protein